MKGIIITSARPHKGLLIASAIWIICILSAFFAAIIRDNSLTDLWMYALVAAAPALLGFLLWPFIRNEWAQILIILAWLTLAIVACLAIAFVPMAILFMCAPAAAALFEKEKVIEAMFLAAVFAALIYYSGHKDFMVFDSIATDAESQWGKKAGIAATIAFLIAAMYGAADSARYVMPAAPTVERDALLDAIPGGVMKVTPENNIAFATDAAHVIFGLSNKPGLVSVLSIMDSKDKKEGLKNLIQRVRDKQSRESRKFLMLDEGQETHMEFTASPLPGNQVLLHVVDMTAHEARVNSLHEAHVNAQKETDGKTLFFAGVSHELRTPLNAIIGFSDMMRSRLFGPLPGKYAEYANLIHDSGQHMLDLIGDVLDMTKVQAGKYELVYTSFDAADVIRSTIKMIRPTADAAEVKLSSDIIDDPREFIIEADRKALRQMLLNLLSNAIKFTPKGGSVTVTAKMVGHVLNITVEDTGEGMSAKELENVGEPFVQTASGKDSSERGTGLGLSLVKSLAELHRGRLVITSQPGKGTTADIYIPTERKDDKK